MGCAKSFLSVEIIRVDDNKRAIENAEAGKHGLAGSPGLLASFGHRKAFGNVVHLLEHILHVNILLDPVSDDLAEILLKIFSRDKYDLIKSGILRGIDGIIHNDLAGGAYLL